MAKKSDEMDGCSGIMLTCGCFVALLILIPVGGFALVFIGAVLLGIFL